ncbi:hypothetical protein MMC06_003341 [Schaereria dolodes]|nr:hypothetical protein [Schaereria dolodes]
MPPTTTHFSSSADPLPSPSTNQSNQYFAPSQPHQRWASGPQTQPASYAPPHASSSTAQAQHAQHAQQEAPGDRGHDGRRGGANDPTASTPFLRDFTLVAEAAKRAQMAVLMRDMGEVSL